MGYLLLQKTNVIDLRREVEVFVENYLTNMELSGE